MFDIDLDLNKDIQDLPPGLSNGHKARMSIMNQEIAVHKIRSDVIDTTRAICHITHDNDVDMDLVDLETEGFEDVGDDAGVEHEAFGKLEGDADILSVEVFGGLLDAVEGFEDLEVVVGGEDAEGVLEVGVLGVVLWDAGDEVFGLFGLLDLGWGWVQLCLLAVGRLLVFHIIKLILWFCYKQVQKVIPNDLPNQIKSFTKLTNPHTIKVTDKE